MGNSKNYRRRGLVLYWKASLNLVVEDPHKYNIDTSINKNTKTEWRFIGFYGEPETFKEHKTWSKLRGLNKRPNLPWICADDFNKIMKLVEKLGWALSNHNHMQLFTDMIDECGFMDLGYMSTNFTWSKHFEDGHSIWERLDKALATSNWLLRFLGTRVTHLFCHSLDQTPFLINHFGLEIPPRKRIFRFEEMWLSDSLYGETIKTSWLASVRSGASTDVLMKVENCSKDLT